MKKILYIGNPKSIHDIKWASFFSEKKEAYQVFFISEKEVCVKDAVLSKTLNEKNIELLDSLESFSLSKPIQTFKNIQYLRKIIQKHQIDLVHILFSAPFSLWALFISKPTIITNRGSDILIEIPKLLQQGIKGKLFYKLFNKAFQKSAITATSQKQVDQVKTLFNLNATLIRTGVDVAKIENLTQNIKRENIIFSPRYFRPIYNIEIQIEAISKLPLAILQTHQFVFIKGKNPDVKYAEKLELSLLELKKTKHLNYQIITSLEQEEMFALYGKSALTIMTPHSDGTPNSALEAMAAKCPLILPNLDYDEQLFKNTCLILEQNNADLLTSLIVKSLSSYPKDKIEKAFEQTNLYGNRIVEMNKLDLIYKNIMKTE